MKAGELYAKVAFDKRSEMSDGAGNTVGDWVEQFQCRASVVILRGGENVMAARLEGRKPVIVGVRNEARTRLITTDWRCRNVFTNESFNVRSVQPSDKRDNIELLCEIGVANG